jgi:hypothetical protein
MNLWKDPLPGFKKAVIVYGLFLVGEFSLPVFDGSTKSSVGKGVSGVINGTIV